MDVVKRYSGDCVAVIVMASLLSKIMVSEVSRTLKTPPVQKFLFQPTSAIGHSSDYQCLKASPKSYQQRADAAHGVHRAACDAPLSETARRFNVNNNIISAQMDYAGGCEVRHYANGNAHGTQEET